MKPTRLLAWLFAAFAAAALLSACQLPAQRADRPAHFGSMAQITAISPDPALVLRPGEPVRLKVDVSHVLTTASGTLTLVVLAADNAILGQDSRAIARGQGHSTLEAAFTVPRTTVVRIFTALDLQAPGASSVADGRSFEVSPR